MNARDKHMLGTAKPTPQVSNTAPPAPEQQSWKRHSHHRPSAAAAAFATTLVQGSSRQLVAEALFALSVARQAGAHNALLRVLSLAEKTTKLRAEKSDSRYIEGFTEALEIISSLIKEIIDTELEAKSD